MNIELTGLNAAQREICDALWACDTVEEVSEYLSIVPPSKRSMAVAMLHYMVAECLDQQVENCNDADAVISHIKNM